jgi:pimeloyl-ACP methyl ester carboxylesterase
MLRGEPPDWNEQWSAWVRFVNAEAYVCSRSAPIGQNGRSAEDRRKFSTDGAARYASCLPIWMKGGSLHERRHLASAIVPEPPGGKWFMPQIVAVHGIAQQFLGEHLLHAAWLPALRSGLSRVGVDLPSEDDLRCAFYGDLFRKKGTKALGDVPYDASDVTEWEQELLEMWWREAARVEPQVPGPDAQTKLRTPRIVQRALNALSNSRFFGSLAERVLIGSLKQVRRYLNDETMRKYIQERVIREVTADTRVIVGHSLGSVVAYEVLCQNPDWHIEMFVTLGSPLGIRRLIFDRLHPAPVNETGVWPRSVRNWTNIADGGDVVALEKQLARCFGERVRDELIYNGAKAHDVSPYLTAVETGRAIAAGFRC